MFEVISLIMNNVWSYKFDYELLKFKKVNGDKHIIKHNKNKHNIRAEWTSKMPHSIKR